LTHSYIPLDQYRRKWIFNHKDLPVSDEDKALIRPLDDKSAMAVWKALVSNQSSHAEQFGKGDWQTRAKTWVKTDFWQAAWDSEAAELPQNLAEFIHWPDDTRVYFCYEKYQVIETRWDVYRRNWKCFLFFDDGPLLLSDSAKQAVWFEQTGQYHLGTRP